MFDWALNTPKGCGKCIFRGLSQFEKYGFGFRGSLDCKQKNEYLFCEVNDYI